MLFVITKKAPKNKLEIYKHDAYGENCKILLRCMTLERESKVMFLNGKTQYFKYIYIHPIFDKCNSYDSKQVHLKICRRIRL